MVIFISDTSMSITNKETRETSLTTVTLYNIEISSQNLGLYKICISLNVPSVTKLTRDKSLFLIWVSESFVSIF